MTRPAARDIYRVAERAMRLWFRDEDLDRDARYVLGLACGWHPGRQRRASSEPWPVWHPLITGRPRRRPLHEEDSGAIAMELRHFVRARMRDDYQRPRWP